MSVNNTEDTIIPAADWISVIKPLLDEGHQLKICPAGRSMVPFLTGGRDEACLSSISGHHLKRGDIVLYSRFDGIFVLHRIHHITRGLYYMLGDYHTDIEGPIDLEQIHAIAVSIVRKGRFISCDSQLFRFLSTIWLLMRPLRPFVFRLRSMQFRHKRKH